MSRTPDTLAAFLSDRSERLWRLEHTQKSMEWLGPKDLRENDLARVHSALVAMGVIAYPWSPDGSIPVFRLLRAWLEKTGYAPGTDEAGLFDQALGSLERHARALDSRNRASERPPCPDPLPAGPLLPNVGARRIKLTRNRWKSYTGAQYGCRWPAAWAGQMAVGFAEESFLRVHLEQRTRGGPAEVVCSVVRFPPDLGSWQVTQPLVLPGNQAVRTLASRSRGDAFLVSLTLADGQVECWIIRDDGELSAARQPTESNVIPVRANSESAGGDVRIERTPGDGYQLLCGSGQDQQVLYRGTYPHDAPLHAPARLSASNKQRLFWLDGAGPIEVLTARLQRRGLGKVLRLPLTHDLPPVFWQMGRVAGQWVEAWAYPPRVNSRARTRRPRAPRKPPTLIRSMDHRVVVIERYGLQLYRPVMGATEQRVHLESETVPLLLAGDLLVGEEDEPAAGYRVKVGNVDLGRFNPRDTATLRRFLAEEHPLANEPVQVEATQLLATPAKWDGVRVCTTAHWYRGFEESLLVPAGVRQNPWKAPCILWIEEGYAFDGLFGPAVQPAQIIRKLLRLDGILCCREGDGYGHMGGADARLTLLSAAVVE